MPFPVLATLTHRALRSGAPKVDFIWHGGEPLLLGIPFYLKALRLQDEFCVPGQRVSNSLKAKGTLLDDQWCEFFLGAGFSIGLSLDGPPELHNRTRVNVGRARFDAVNRGVQLLQAHGVPFGVLMVLNQEAIGFGAERLWHFFVDELRVQGIFVLACASSNSPSHGSGLDSYITPDQFAAFMIEIFDLWMEREDPGINIRELNSLLNAVMGASSTVCTFARRLHRAVFSR